MRTGQVMYLMASDQQVQLVELQESSSDVWTKRNAHAPLVRTAPLARLGVAPEQLAHEAIIRRLPAKKVAEVDTCTVLSALILLLLILSIMQMLEVCIDIFVRH